MKRGEEKNRVPGENLSKQKIQREPTTRVGDQRIASPTRCRPTLGSRGYFLFFLGISRTISGARVLSSKLPPLNLVPRALFPGFGPAPKAREKRPGDEVGLLCPVKSPLVLT